MSRKTYDVVFLHPPFSIDKYSLFKKLLFWKKNDIFGEFTEIPMGLFSMASFLEDEGFSVKVFNLALEQILNPTIMIKNFLKSLESKVYAIDLHWFIHALGSLEVAKLCKKYHSNRFVVLGGFTATYYDLEIMQSYRFIDAIARGEAEIVLLDLVKSLCSGKEKDIKYINGLTYRFKDTIKRNEVNPPSNLNRFDFVNLRLMENWYKQVKCCARGYEKNRKPSFWLTIGRGCLRECIYCGGARSCYQILTGRTKPIVREINGIIEDITRLTENGIKIIKFNHDPEMFGKQFSSSLLNSLKSLSADISVYWESSMLPSRTFIEEAKKVFVDLNVAISPESTQENVRKFAGRSFTNEQLFKTIDFLNRNKIMTDIYFLIGLPGETVASANKIIEFTNKVAKNKYSLVQPPIPYTIDPHCPMAINSQKYGIRLFFKSFHDYRKVCLESNWEKWIGHETETLSRTEIANLTANIWKTILEIHQEGVAAKISFDYEK